MTELSKDDVHFPALRRAVLIVACLNFAYFFVEAAVAWLIGSVSLIADSVDFLEDASVNALILLALGWSATARAKAGMAMAVFMVVPAVATLWMIWRKFNAPVPPQAFELGATGAGALVVNVFCAYLLARFREHSGSLTKAAFLSARNDAVANVAIIATGFVTAYTMSGWPDIVVGLGIAAMNADAAREVWSAARAEHRAAS